MEEIKQLLKNYLNNLISAKDFVHQFFKLAGKARDDGLKILNQNQNLKTQLEELFTRRIERTIGEIYYQKSWQKLVSQLPQIEKLAVKPFSAEEIALSHLFVEADAYREDPNDRIKGFNIGESELRIEVTKTLEILENPLDFTD